MKKIYFLLIVLFSIVNANAQIINFPDANLKAKLLTANTGVNVASILGTYPGQPSTYNKIDTNNDGEIQISEALLIKYLNISSANVTNLTGLSYFSNLENLICNYNKISNVSEINLMTSLRQFHIWYNDNISLTEINLTNLTNLQYLQLGASKIYSLNVSNNIKLKGLSCQLNYLTTLNISNCPQLNYLQCFGNSISYLNIKNGNLNPWVTLQLSGSNYDNSANAYRYICVDEEDLDSMQINTSGYQNCHVNTYCSFTPGNFYYTIQGKSIFDILNNGCDVNDIPFKNLQVSINNGTSTSFLINDNSGNYFIPVGNGNYSITPILENPNYFLASPNNISVSFPAQASPVAQDICITANGVHPDLEISILPINAARPGFDAKYRLVYKNKGNTTQSGAVNVSFNDAVLDFVSANPVVTTQAINNLSWNFSNLLPFETREIAFTLNVNSPMETPAVNAGDILNYTATITSPAIDDLPNDNNFVFNQTVVNSYDPNDKKCLEGATIPPAKVGDYVHYMIRFENTGTYPAENIVVKDMIDTNKFDINSLIPIKGSHSFVTNISAGNKVEFIFENINLPFDDANNDGYVAFKIKTKPNLVLGDTFSNTASIYFDYNFPIVTNTATTTIQALSRQDFEFSNYFKLYPNPVSTTLNIETKDAIEISSINIYNTLGQLVLVVPNAQNIKMVDVSSLSSGNYFIKINSDKGTSNTKFIKQ